VALLLDRAAFGAHPVGPTGRVASLVVVRRIAVGTLERRTQPALSPLGGDHPRALLPRRTVADVLAVAALEERHPVPHFVLLEADDAAPHERSVCLLDDEPSTIFIVMR
jgi:hypothetical protein